MTRTLGRAASVDEGYQRTITAWRRESTLRTLRYPPLRHCPGATEAPTALQIEMRHLSESGENNGDLRLIEDAVAEILIR
jgi:hypothetical protein